MARGTVSWGLKDDAAGELQLWYHEMRYNDYCLFAGNTAGDDITVCKVIDVFTLHFLKCTAYSTLRNETKRNEMVLCEMVLCETITQAPMRLNFSLRRPNPEN